MAGFGNWRTIHARMNRRSRNRVLDQVLAHRQRERILRIELEAASLDNTIVKAHPDGTGA